MNEYDAFARLGGMAAEVADSFKKAAREMSERTTLSTEEALDKILGVLGAFQNGIEAAFGAALETAETVMQELSEELELLDAEPRARRRKQERTRARYIEQHYRAEIRRCEQSRPYRRIYKPP